MTKCNCEYDSDGGPCLKCGKSFIDTMGDILEERSMANYRFKIKSDVVKLKKSTFVISLEDNISPVDMFEEAIMYLNDHVNTYFKLYGCDLYESFLLIRGKKQVDCDLEHESCCNCGGNTNISGEYYED